jgi:hypothetical protein
MKIIGPKKDEVTREWRTLHRRDSHNFCSSPNIIGQIKSSIIRWAGQVARMGEGRKVYRVLVGKPEGKRRLGRPRRRWDQNESLGDWLGGCGVDSPGSV